MPFSDLERGEVDVPTDRAGLARHLWLWFFGLMGAAATGYAVSPPGLAKLIFWPIIGWSSVAAICLGVRIHKPSHRLPWYFLAVGTTLFSFGDNLYTFRAQIQHSDAMFPSYVDVVYLAMYPTMILGLALLVRYRTHRRDWVALIDAAIITGAIGLLAWALLIVPYLGGDMAVMERLFSIAYPLGDVALLAVGVRLAVGGGGRSRSFWLLVVALTGLVVADALYGYLNILGVWQEHNPVDAGWILFYAAFGAAALHPSMRELTRTSQAGPMQGSARLVVVGAAALMPPTMLLVEAVTGGVRDAVAIGVVAIGLFALVLIRIAGLARTIAESTGEARFRSLVQNASDATVVLDSAGVVTYETPSTGRVLGTGTVALAGKSLGDLLHPADREKLRHWLAEADASGVGEWRMRAGAGWRYLDVVAADLRDEPSVGGVAVTMRDSTERKKLHEQRETAIAAANEASRQKSVFLANMSHEIRTPLNGLMGMLGLLVDTRLDCQQAEYIDAMSSSAESLAALVNDILDFSRIEAGRLELDKQAFSLRPAVEAALSVSAAALQQKGLALRTEFEPDIPTTVIGDRLRLRQVMSNLVSNATKFTDEGHITVRVRAVGNAVRFEVADTGIGIAPENRDRLFDQYVQADDSTTRRHGGTGLGLAISRQIVELMGGEIGVDSEVGVGSTFWFTVAFEKPASGIPVAGGGGLSDIRVLVVSAQQLLRSTVTAMLAAKQIQASSVGDTDAGLVMVQEAAARNAGYDVVVVDLNLAGVEQVDYIRRLEAASPGRPRIVALTTKARSVPKGAHALDCGWVPKPIRESEFFEIVRAVVDSSSVPVPVSAVAPLSSGEAGPLVATPPATGQNGHILIVEDNVINQRVAAATLKQLGYSSEIAEDGVDALIALEARSFDAILMDCQMPRMDGYETTTEIRRRETATRMPIVAMTASAMESDRERCLAVGMDSYVTKPFDRGALAEVLRHLIGERPDLRVAAGNEH